MFWFDAFVNRTQGRELPEWKLKFHFNSTFFFVQVTLQITLLLFKIYYCKRCVKRSLLDFSSNSTFVCSVVFTWMFTRYSTGLFWVIPRKGDIMSLICLTMQTWHQVLRVFLNTLTKIQKMFSLWHEFPTSCFIIKYVYMLI